MMFTFLVCVFLCLNADVNANLALNKPVRQSSPYKNNAFPPENAVDGKKNTKSVTGRGAISWWSVDLTKGASIDRILCYLHRYAYAKGKYQKYKVETKLRETDVWQVCKEGSVMKPISPYVVQCDNPTTARYIKISVQPDVELYLTEVEVLGTPLLTGFPVPPGDAAAASCNPACRNSICAVLDGKGICICHPGFVKRADGTCEKSVTDGDSGPSGQPGAPGEKEGKKVEDGDWPGNGDAIPLALSDKEMTISGIIKSEKPSGPLPEHSCVTVKLSDVSIMDVASFTLASTKFNVKNANLGEGINFKFVSKKPFDKDLWRSFALSATINVGWCAKENSDEWLRKGDYLNDVQHLVQLVDTSMKYEEKLTVMCYACGGGDKDLVPTKAPDVPAPPQAPKDVPALPQAPTKGKKVKEGGWLIGGEAIPIPLSDEEITISGTIRSKTPSGPLPANSCATIKLSDISIQDIPSFTLASMKIPLTNVNLGDGIKFKLVSKKPFDKDLWRMFSLSATINVGWCSKKGPGEWLRRGDYLNDMHHLVLLGLPAYEMELAVKCYACDAKDPTTTKAPIIDGAAPPPVVSADGAAPPPIVSSDGAAPPPVFSADSPAPAPVRVAGMKVSVGGGWLTGGKAIPIPLSDKEITIYGTIRSKAPSGPLPANSCATIKLSDISIQDIASFTLASMKIPLTNVNLGDGIKFKLVSKKPFDKDLWRMFSLSATINVGWCSKQGSGEWLRKGDYLNNMHHLVVLDDNMKYEKTVAVKCYVCGDGDKVPATTKAPVPKPEIGACDKLVLKSLMAGPPKPGQYVPQCESDGTFTKKQCHHSTGHCWCVNTNDGTEITGTKKGPGEGEVKCEADKTPAAGPRPKLACGYDCSKAVDNPVCGTDGKTYDHKCHIDAVRICDQKDVKFLHDGPCISDGDVPAPIVDPPQPEPEPNLPECVKITKNLSKNLLGQYVPQCESDGTFKRKQCHSSTGHCWCVDIDDGTEISGTRKGSGEGEVKCGICDIAKTNSPIGMLGAYVPSCKDEGTYEDKQCHASTGFCWCVTSATGVEIKGTRKGPGQGKVDCDRCSLPHVVGFCKAYFPSFYYDGGTKTCKPFVYGGCQGNSNRFDTVEDCMKACGPK